MATKKNYINLIRWSCIIDSFNNHLYQLIKNIERIKLINNI